MLELYAMNAINGNKNWADMTADERREHVASMSIGITILLIVWIWAIVRALRCSNKTPDSRAVHLFFATVSPILYLIFSYFVGGFCKK